MFSHNSVYATKQSVIAACNKVKLGHSIIPIHCEGFELKDSLALYYQVEHLAKAQSYIFDEKY